MITLSKNKGSHIVGIFRYWLLAEPIPVGWEFGRSLADTHHGSHSCIIRKICTE